jgi:tetratricopeptide (TPR) repeat protein
MQRWLSALIVIWLCHPVHGEDERGLLRSAAHWADAGPLGRLELAVWERAVDPRRRQQAARAHGRLESELEHLVDQVRDPDPGVSAVVVHSLLFARGVEPGLDGHWTVNLPLTLLRRGVEARDPELAARIGPMIDDAMSRYILGELQRLVVEYDSIYFNEMFERIGTLGDLAIRPLLAIFSGAVFEDEGSSAARARVSDYAGKALGDLRLKSARMELLKLYELMGTLMASVSELDQGPLVTAEVSLFKLGVKDPAEQRTRSYSMRVRTLSDRGAQWALYQDRLAHHYLRLELYSEAIAAYQQLIQRGELLSHAHYNSACAYAKLGKVDQGIQHLEIAIDNGFDDAEQIDSDRDLDNLRKNPRYHALLQRLRQR